MKAMSLFLVFTLAAFGLVAQPDPPKPDNDGDGFTARELGGTDCDDFNPFVYPGAPGTARNIDCDCNGMIDPDEEWLVMPDVNNDSQIGSEDLLTVLGAFGDATASYADVNRDGQVDVQDVLDLRQYKATTYAGW